jgi:ribonuclease Z
MLAAEARVQALVFTHLIPPVPGGILDGPFLDGAGSQFGGPMWMGEDGDLISLPAGTVTRSRRNLL